MLLHVEDVRGSAKISKDPNQTIKYTYNRPKGYTYAYRSNELGSPYTGSPSPYSWLLSTAIVNLW